MPTVTPSAIGSLSKTLVASLLAASATCALADSADDTADSVVALDQVDVSTTRADDYGAPAMALAGKDGIALAENPQAIAIVPRALLEDLRPLKLEDALVGVAGVAVGGYYNDWDYIRIRGFNASANTYLDGLRGGGGNFSMGEELFGLEQIEVVKGPAALYGSGPVGGLVNLVSKRPSADAFAKVGATIGSDAFYESTFDFNRPLGTNENVVFRLVSLYRDQESYVDYVESDRLYLAPSLTWRIGTDTSFTLLTRHVERHTVMNMPLPAAGTVLPNPNGKIAFDLYTGEPGSNRLWERSSHAGYEFVHAFNDSLSLTQNLRYDVYDSTGDDLLYPLYLSDDQNTLYRYPWDCDEHWTAFTVDTRLAAELGNRSAPVRHSLLGGVDYYRRKSTADYDYASGATPLNLFAPVYGTSVVPTDISYSSASHSEITGFYVQDHVTLPARVTLTVGGRYDFTDVDDVREEAFTGRAGATWEFVPGAVAYASYSEAFNAQWGTTAAGDAVEPETGDNLETGLRNAFLGGRLTATFAVYQITRRNVATVDLANPGYYLTAGEQRSRGVELDARYAPVKGWDLLAAYAYTDTEIVRDNAIAAGTRLAAVPLHAFNAWTKYTLPSGTLRGFGLGVGATYTSTQDGDLTYVRDFELPAYVLWRAALYYDRGPFSTQLNVTNVFDKEYYAGAYSDLYVNPGEGRTVRVSCSWRF